MIHLGLIGWPVSHSLSPKMHNAAFRALKMDGEYSLCPVEPGSSTALEFVLDQVRVGNLAGLNVTIPYKQTVIPLLGRLTPAAAAIGAVNTIYFDQEQLVGDNTDAPGFISDLRKFAGEKFEEQPEKIIVLGAGGSARAVTWALAKDSTPILVAARNIGQAKHLVDSIRLSRDGANLEAIELSVNALRNQFDHTKLIVNTTPLGMIPNIDLSPWPDELDFPGSAIVYDLIYNPRETRLINRARKKGLRASTGLGMLVEQAALGFEIWTGCKPDRDLMLSSLEE